MGRKKEIDQSPGAAALQKEAKAAEQKMWDRAADSLDDLQQQTGQQSTGFRGLSRFVRSGKIS